MNDTAARPGRPLRAILVAFGLTVAAFVGSAVVSIPFLVPMLLSGYAVDSTPVLVVGMIATQLGFLAVGFLYVRRTDVRIPVSWPARSSLLFTVGGVVAALVVAIGLLTLVGILGLQPDSALEETAALDPTFLLALAVLSIVLIAPAEEFLFRGVVQGRLRKAIGPVGAVAGASLLFGSMHLLNYVGSPAQMLAGAGVIACVSVVFGALYELTDNLVVPIAVHAIYNVVLMVTSYLAI